VPEGFAHGFLTLEPTTEVLYQMSEFYAPEAARGARHDDPAFGIVWPAPVAVIAERDATYPDFAGQPR
jgi:dTDP-4-dehydrorhamnose 3,5-epimerase